MSDEGSVTIENTGNEILLVEAQSAIPRPCELYKAGKKDEEKFLDLPTKFSLGQNYPNPFNPTTVINYSLPIDNYVTLKVYDVLGREVSMLVDEYKDAGYYEVEFNGSSLSSGVYFYKLTAGSYTAMKKLLITK
ncbi:MAG: T9SS type A sorting domain-containing protein [Bacteroidota bacterium]|nr:T9SS type A sorting domain-containing protein [Bacteroidota bacterium]